MELSIIRLKRIKDTETVKKNQLEFKKKTHTRKHSDKSIKQFASLKGKKCHENSGVVNKIEAKWKDPD